MNPGALLVIGLVLVFAAGFIAGVSYAGQPRVARRTLQRRFDNLAQDPHAPPDLQRYARRVLDALDG